MIGTGMGAYMQQGNTDAISPLSGYLTLGAGGQGTAAPMTTSSAYGLGAMTSTQAGAAIGWGLWLATLGIGGYFGWKFAKKRTKSTALRLAGAYTGWAIVHRAVILLAVGAFAAHKVTT